MEEFNGRIQRVFIRGSTIRPSDKLQLTISSFAHFFG
jgi:hypothetical protein